MSAYATPMAAAVLVAALLAACSDSDGDNPPPPPPPPPPPAALELTRVTGGQLGDLVVSGELAYVATGRGVAVWDFSTPSTPVQVGTANVPAGALITGLAHYGDHLYASWQRGNDRGGLTIYSLADPLSPDFVSEMPTPADFSHVNAIAAANDHVYLFDSENGIWVGSLADPEAPVLTTDGTGLGGAFDEVFTDGNLIHTFGKSFLGAAVLTTYDVSTPESPVERQVFAADGIDFFDLKFNAPYAIGFGAKLSILDLSNPDRVVPRGSADTLAMTGIFNTSNAYGLGFEGLDVWDITDPDSPTLINNLDLDTFLASATATVPGGALMLTSTDRFVFLDTSAPATPTVAGSAVMSGSVDAYDAALVNDTVLFLQQNYGLAIADATSLDVIGRHEFDLPASPQDRVFSDMQVNGNVAYLAAWGFELILADVTDPRAPTEIGRLQAFFAHTVAVADGVAYIGKNTNGPEFGIVDVSDPESPAFVSSYSINFSPAQLAVRGGLLFIAGYSNGGLESVGLRIIDVSDPANAAEAGFYDEECPAAFEVKLVDDLAYLACSNGLHILDIADATAPVRVGRGENDDLLDVRTSVEVRGDRAWFGSGTGIVEFDVSDPASPEELGATDTGSYGPINLRAIEDDRMLGLFGIAGVHVFEEP